MVKRMPLPEDLSTVSAPSPMPGFAGVISKIPKPPPRREVALTDELALLDQGPAAPPTFTIDEKTEPQKVSGRQLLQLDVKLIDPNPFAPREVYTPAMIKARADALRTQGQHDPIHVIPNAEAEGRFIICDGWTRVQACLQHKILDSLLAEVHAGLSLKESAWFGYQQNEEREQHCDLDRAMFYEKMIKAGMSATQLAAKVGLSKAAMSTYRAFAKLPEDVMEIVRLDTRRFSAYPVSYIQRVCDRLGALQGVRLAVEFSTNGQSHTWLVNRANTLLDPKKRNSPLPSVSVRYRNGFYKNQGQNFSISLCVADDKVEQFRAGIEALLATVADTSCDDPSSGETPAD